VTTTINDDQISMWKLEGKRTLGNEAWVENSVHITLNEKRLEYDEECMILSYGALCSRGNNSGIKSGGIAVS
jgi:hypothetical protein